MDGQWIGLIGVAAGGLIAGANSWIGEHRQSRRQERLRWHEQRLAAYTTTWLRLSNVYEVMAGTARGARSRLQPPWKPFEVKRQLGSVEEVLREALAALTVIRFVGSREVLEAADACADVVAALGDAGGDSGTVSDARLDELLADLNRARNHLVDVARAELGVERPPRRRWWRRGYRSAQVRRDGGLDRKSVV